METGLQSFFLNTLQRAMVTILRSLTCKKNEPVNAPLVLVLRSAVTARGFHEETPLDLIEVE
jgi:hypothetical protein